MSSSSSTTTTMQQMMKRGTKRKSELLLNLYFSDNPTPKPTTKEEIQQLIEAEYESRLWTNEMKYYYEMVIPKLIETQMEIPVQIIEYSSILSDIKFHESTARARLIDTTKTEGGDGEHVLTVEITPNQFYISNWKCAHYNTAPPCLSIQATQRTSSGELANRAKYTTIAPSMDFSNHPAVKTKITERNWQIYETESYTQFAPLMFCLEHKWIHGIVPNMSLGIRMNIGRYLIQDYLLSFDSFCERHFGHDLIDLICSFI